jgi:fucose 4-O-acetylase-like acetyltransferase
MARLERVAWIDAARGVGIILVVMGHVERGLVSAGIAKDPSWLALDYTLYTFHMPLFFLLAGLNARHSVERGAKPFLLNKLVTIVFPYFLWSLLQGVVLVAASSLTNNKADMGSLLSIGWKPMSQFWFLYALMLCNIVLAITKYRPRLLAVLSVTALIGSQFVADGNIIERFLFSLPFFLIGVALAPSAKTWGQVAPSVLSLLLWAAFGGVVWLTRTYNGPDFASLGVLPATALGIWAMVATARMLSGPVLAGATLLGAASMSIYVMHIVAAAGLRIVLSKLGAPPEAWLYFLLCSVVGLIAPLAAHKVLERFGLLPALGLAAPKWLSRTGGQRRTEPEAVASEGA